eukprot:COSAG01_NODE_41274_length_453_cov_1.689266_1_plen_98_part_01
MSTNTPAKTGRTPSTTASAILLHTSREAETHYSAHVRKLAVPVISGEGTLAAGVVLFPTTGVAAQRRHQAGIQRVGQKLGISKVASVWSQFIMTSAC